MSKRAIVNKKTKPTGEKIVCTKKTVMTQKITRTKNIGQKKMIAKKSKYVSADESTDDESVEIDNQSTENDSVENDHESTENDDEPAKNDDESVENNDKSIENDESIEDKIISNKKLKINKKTLPKIDLNGYDDVRNICIAKIDNNYSRGQYGKFDIIMMNKNGRVNASNLCKKGGKLFKNWLRNTTSRELIDELASSAQLRADDLMQTVVGGKNIEVRGTYVNSKLIPHIASWISPSFAIKVSEIVEEYFIKRAIEEKDKVIGQKNDKIDRMSKQLDVLVAESTKMTSQNKLLLNYARSTTSQIDLLHIDNIELKELIGEISKDKVVKLSDPTENDAFVIIQCNNKGDGGKNFYVIRTLKKSMPKTIEKYKLNNKFARVVLRIDNPHGINFWKRIGKKYGQKGDKPLLRIKGNNFKLINNCSVHKMKEIVMKIHNERLNNE
jgi:hypothetical protein